MVAACMLVGCSSGRGAVGDDAVDAGIDGPIDAATDLVDPQWPEDQPLPPELDLPPYVNLLDASTVAISWRTTASTTGLVRYGTTAAMGEQVASTTSANLHHVTLGGLVAGSAYYYEVAVAGTSARRKGVFVMPGRTQWRFVAVGEFHAASDSADAAKFAAVIRAFRPHVIVESGDMLDDGNSFDQWRSYLRTSAPWISNAVFLPAHSNHVNGSGGNPHLLDLFVLPNNERWYLTRYGQAQFFSIDSTTAANADVMTTELPWIRTQAKLAHDGVDDPAFVIAAWHHPACSSQYYTRRSEREWVQANLIPAFMENGGLDLVLAAHDKYYERSTITGGIAHVITNVGKVSPEIPGGNHAACTAIKTSRTSQSVALVTMDGAMLAARVVDPAGAELDAFSIAK